MIRVIGYWSGGGMEEEGLCFNVCQEKEMIRERMYIIRCCLIVNEVHGRMRIQKVDGDR